MEPGDPSEPTKEMRRRAKAVNFGVVYGQGENALAKSLGITKEEAGSFIARYFERYSSVRAYMDEQIEIARKAWACTRSSVGDASSPTSSPPIARCACRPSASPATRPSRAPPPTSSARGWSR